MKILVGLLLSLTGCSQIQKHRNTFLSAGVGAIIGGAYGYSRPEEKSKNATMYSSVGALVAGSLSLAFNLDGLNDDQLKVENGYLKNKLDDFQKRLEPKLISEGKSLYSSPLPKDMQALIEPGEWKRYKMDQWVQDPNQPNTWFRQIEMFEIIPPVSK